MSALNYLPLEFNDFSGGVTENFLQGDPRRYKSADNFLIRVDKKLEERPGSILYDLANPLLPCGNRRITGLYSVINESILLAQSGRNLYTKDLRTNTWLSILGPSGNEPIQGGDIYAQATYGEFQRQIYFTSDGSPSENGALPSKLFRDKNNNWTAITAGLPRSFKAAPFTDASLLAQCILLANALRASFILHLSDNAGIGSGSSPTNLHKIADKYSLSYLIAESFNPLLDPEIPKPLPTPAPNATDQSSLFTLVTALNKAYTHHMRDVGNAVQTVNNFYHFDIQLDTEGVDKGIAAELSNPGAPIDLVGCAHQLNDLHQKWYWHRNAIWTHSPNNNPVQFNRYDPTQGKIGDFYGKVSTSPLAPSVTPDFKDLFNYVNALKAVYNNHVNNLTSPGPLAHTQSTFTTNDQQVKLQDCNSLDSMYLLIYWLRVAYGGVHVIDSNIANHTTINFTSTNGSPNLTAILGLFSLAPQTIPIGAWIYAPGVFTGNVARVTASASGTATVDRNAILSHAGNHGQYSASFYHGAFGNGLFIDSTSSLVQNSDFLTTPPTQIGVSLLDWLSLGDELFFALASHMLNGGVHPSSDFFGDEVGNLGYPFFIPSISTVVYGFFYSHDYVVEPNGVEYLVEGNPVFTDSIPIGVSYPVGTTIRTKNSNYYNDAIVIQTRSNQIVQIPVLTNDSRTNYDTSNVKVEIYRTTDGGNTFFALGEIANGTKAYTDTTNDSIPNPGQIPFNTGQNIYTSGGVVGNDPPPQAKFIHILNNVALYGAITDTDQFFPQRIRQALPGLPDSAPATFSDDLDDSLVGLSSTRNNFIAFCTNSIYRIQGGFNKLGQGTLTHERISDTLGALNAKSIVRTEIGIFFAANDGFYYTDGFQIIPITLELKKTYAALTASANQRARIYGAYDKVTRRIWWAMQSNPTDTDNDVCFIYYLEYGVKPSGTFTVAKNGSYWRPSSLVFQNGVLVRGDERGYLFKSDIWTKTDPKVDITLPANQWNTVVIPYNFTTLAVDMGSTFKRKWLSKLHIVGNNSGNMAIQPYAIRDLNQTAKGIKPITAINYVDNCRWGAPLFQWGDSSFIWRFDGKMDTWRRFPQTSARNDFLQVELLPAKVAVYASSIGFPAGANASVDSVGKTATLLSPAPYTSIVWPRDVVDYVIAFQVDNYIQEFLITALDVTGKIITFSDPGNLSLTLASSPWVIRGVKKEQRVTITSLVLHFAYLGDKNQAYPGAASTAGAGNGGENPN